MLLCRLYLNHSDCSQLLHQVSFQLSVCSNWAPMYLQANSSLDISIWWAIPVFWNNWWMRWLWERKNNSSGLNLILNTPCPNSHFDLKGKDRMVNTYISMARWKYISSFLCQNPAPNVTWNQNKNERALIVTQCFTFMCPLLSALKDTWRRRGALQNLLLFTFCNDCFLIHFLFSCWWSWSQAGLQ